MDKLYKVCVASTAYDLGRQISNALEEGYDHVGNLVIIPQGFDGCNFYQAVWKLPEMFDVDMTQLEAELSEPLGVA